MIYVYGDDGADANKERALAVAVIAGFEEWWEQAESEWIVRCGGIPFHATDCESDRGDFAQFSHKENKARYKDLTGILAASKLGGIGIAMDLRALEKAFPGRLQLTYYHAFLECVEKAATVAENYGEISKLTFDVSSENEYNAGALYSVMRNNDARLVERLDAEIGFTTWRGSPRVQMADLLTYESWKALDHSVGPKKRNRNSWDALRATNRFQTLGYSEDWVRSFKDAVDSKALEREAGFNEKDYLQWLSAKKLKHNISNYIAFIGVKR